MKQAVSKKDFRVGTVLPGITISSFFFVEAKRWTWAKR